MEEIKDINQSIYNNSVQCKLNYIMEQLYIQHEMLCMIMCHIQNDDTTIKDIWEQLNPDNECYIHPEVPCNHDHDDL